MRARILAVLFALGCGSTRDEVDAAVDASSSDGRSDAATVCQANSDCTPDMFCIVPCNTTAPPQTCRLRPTCDDASVQLVCGCDGHVYESACLAMAVGVTPSVVASDCPAPPGEFACYDTYCDAGTYCQHVGSAPDPTTCVVLPAACAGSTDCACFGDAGGCGTCSYVQDAGFLWTCSGD